MIQMLLLYVLENPWWCMWFYHAKKYMARLAYNYMHSNNTRPWPHGIMGRHECSPGPRRDLNACLPACLHGQVPLRIGHCWCWSLESQPKRGQTWFGRTPIGLRMDFSL